MLGANRSSARSIVKTYVVQQPGKGEIRYQDRKRYLWLLSVLFPLLPFVGMALMARSGQEWTLWVPLVGLYILIPLLDFLFPRDANNPPEAVVPLLEADDYYRVLVHLTVPMYFVVLIAGACADNDDGTPDSEEAAREAEAREGEGSEPDALPEADAAEHRDEGQSEAEPEAEDGGLLRSWCDSDNVLIYLVPTRLARSETVPKASRVGSASTASAMRRSVGVSVLPAAATRSSVDDF